MTRPPGTALGALVVLLALAGCRESGGPTGPETETSPPWTPPEPLVLDTRPFPPLPQDAANPLTVAGADLGRTLFHDPILSRDGSLSCAGCHRPEQAFSDAGRKTSLGVEGRAGTRNTPGLFNLAWARALFWDGRAPDLESQALEPVRSSHEMDLPWPEVGARLRADSGYRAGFRRAFGTESIDSALVAKALAQFQRTLLSTRSRYDRWKAAEIDFTDQEYRGYQVFNTEAGECFHCHGEPFFTNFAFHNIGLDSLVEGTGLGGRTGRAGDMGKWKVPSLRNLAFSAPYMHDGRFATLGEVIDFYQSGGHYSPTLDPLIRNPGSPFAKLRGAQGLGLTPAQKEELIAFLATLNDSSATANHLP